MSNAACADIKDRSVFFSNDRGRFKEADTAFAYCLVCPVRDKCIDYGIHTESGDGIWGLLYPQDLKEMDDFAMSHNPYEAFGGVADTVAWLLCEDHLVYEQA